MKILKIKFEHFLKCMYRLLICRGLALLTSAGSDGIIGRGRDDFTDARQTQATKAKLRGL